MIAEPAAWFAIALMAAVTFATRIVGPRIMTWLPSTSRVERFLDNLSTSVIVAIVAGFLARGTLREGLALAAGGTAMLVSRRPLPSMLIAVVIAAAWANWGR